MAVSKVIDLIYFNNIYKYVSYKILQFLKPFTIRADLDTTGILYVEWQCLSMWLYN